MKSRHSSAAMAATVLVCSCACTCPGAAAAPPPRPGPGHIPEVQRILGRRMTNGNSASDVPPSSFHSYREGRAELIQLDSNRFGLDSDDLDALVSGGFRQQERGVLDIPGPSLRAFKKSNLDDELQLALVSPHSDRFLSADFGISIETPLSPSISWDVNADVMAATAASTNTAKTSNSNNNDGWAATSLPKTSSFQYRKTGTTIVGCLADSGRTVVIAADTRATDGTTVADPRCEKVHRIADNVWCCGAGTSGDIDALVRQAKYTFLLRGAISDSIGNGHIGGRVTSSNTDQPEQARPWLPKAAPSAVVRFFRDILYESGGNVGANLVLGGYDVDEEQAVLVAIHPHGSVDSIRFTALGSGGLAAMSVLESRHKPELTVEEAIQLCKDAVASGISNDLGSGSQIDLCIISPEGVQYQRAVVEEESLPISEGDIASENMLRQRIAADADDGLILDGVCGFGSLPYAIKSKRVVLQDEIRTKSGFQTEIEEMLGS